MKLQYLGDSKDSFKWDYHDYLVDELGYLNFNIVPMMTLDDKSNDGKTPPWIFPARKEIIEFCKKLREKRNIDLIRELPTQTGSRYKLDIYEPKTYLTNQIRMNYFDGFRGIEDQVIFLDPDTGFEPEKSFSKKHVRYSDITRILSHVSERSIISVFQHFRRISFKEDFARIRQRLSGCYSTAFYWHSLMFVAISRSKKVIEKVFDINMRYSGNYPNELTVIPRGKEEDLTK